MTLPWTVATGVYSGRDFYTAEGPLVRDEPRIPRGHVRYWVVRPVHSGPRTWRADCSMPGKDTLQKLGDFTTARRGQAACEAHAVQVRGGSAVTE